MPLKNYIEISKSYSSVDAGFQFEFSCNNCPTKWKSPLKPFKRGRIVGLIYSLGYVVSGTYGPENFARRVSGVGFDKVRDEALAEAQALAASRFTECERCGRTCCNDCFDERQHLCNGCARENHGRGQQHAGNSYGGAQEAGGASCPNCGTPGLGGRFCAECGFDMANTHKSCPQCGAMSERGARFCTDCGHGF